MTSGSSEDGRFDRTVLPTRSAIFRRISNLLWPVRSARAQRLAGEESARQAVRLTEADIDSSAVDASEPVLRVGADPLPTDPLPVPGEAGDAADDGHEDTTPEGPAVEIDEDESEQVGDDAEPDAAADAEETPHAGDPESAAFFDVDNTLIQGASIIHFGRGLAKHKFFTTADLLDMAWTQMKFQVSGKENADDVASGREKALMFVKGRTVEELVTLGEEIFDESMVERIWPGTRALTQMHMDAGQQVWLVTATPVELARVIAQRLGLSGALGTVAESVDGVYTGRLVGDILHGPGKAHAIEGLVEQEGFDLSKCYAYSDSHNDVPMLSMVGHPVAINPDSDLRARAKKEGWEIKDFRVVRTAAKRAAPFGLALGAVGLGAMAAKSETGRRWWNTVVGDSPDTDET